MLPRARPFVEKVGDDWIMTLTIEGQDFLFELVPGSVEALGRQCIWQKPFKNGNIVELRPAKDD